MVFSSIAFLYYFLPLFFLVYYLAGKKIKNVVLLVGSILFYSFGAPKFIFVLLGTTIIDFYLVRAMDRATKKNVRVILLCTSLFMNLSLLFYYKYCGFFVENFNHLIGHFGLQPALWTKLVLPIGISFYTFETLTYVVDVYKKVHRPLNNFWDYQLYIILFPKLIAGPIIRYHDFAGQIQGHLGNDYIDNRLRGLYRFAIGLAKKVMVANVMGLAADIIFKIPSNQLGTATAWMGALSYTFQIYFDFSGYSDMAIGLGLMMGFQFPENFNNPYSALSITDFWRRWHITLGSWMRNYLYIPLGGNRNGGVKVLINLCIVFLASGLWHGAAWGYVVWGLYHGFFLILERLFLGKWLAKIGKLAVLYTFGVVVVGWVFFRLEYLHPGLLYLKRMFLWHPGLELWHPDREYLTFLYIGAFFSFVTLSKWGERVHQAVFHSTYSLKFHYVASFATLVLVIIASGRITVSTFNPFIYFRF